MSLDLDKVQAIAEEAAKRSSIRMREAVETGFSVNEKGPRDLVTEIDVYSEEQIRNAVLKTFPDHLVFGEESSTAAARELGRPWEQLIQEGVCWVIDPLDGTSNFVNTIPHYSISIAVLERGERVFGLVYDVWREELFTARRGAGALLNGRPIHAGKKTELLSAMLATGLPQHPGPNYAPFIAQFSTLIKKCHKLRVFGSAAIDLCWTACGRLDGFFEYGLKPWDVAAGSLIAQEAGAEVGSFVHPGTKFSVFAESILSAGKPLAARLFPLLSKIDREAREG